MKLSIIIINFNTPDLLSDCIQSIQSIESDIEHEIIVVDNASTDKSKVFLKKIEKQKNIGVVRSTENLGFAKANNLGLAKATGEFVLFLNSDTVFTNKILKKMISWLQKHPNVGIASCALANADGSLQRNGGFFPTLWTVFLWMFFIEDLPFVDQVIPTFHPKPSTKTRKQDWVTGAFMISPMSAISKTGNMPEEYFMYTEDIDFCLQFKKHGFEVWYLPQWKITHLGGKSSKPGNSIIREFSSLKIYWRKNFPAWQFPFLKALLKMGSFMRMVIFGILQGKESAHLYAQVFKQI